MIHSRTLLVRLAPSDKSKDTVYGMASTWAVDLQGTYFVRGAWRRSVEAFKAGKLVIPLLRDHTATRQIGGVTALEETSAGLEMEARVVAGTEDSDRVLELAHTVGVGLSVGFVVPEGGAELDAQGRVRYRDVDLHEISAVAVPSNAQCFTQGVRASEFEKLLRAGTPAMPRRLASNIARLALPEVRSAGADPAFAASIARAVWLAGGAVEPEEFEASGTDFSQLQQALAQLHQTLKP